jgi:hypothetical protein
VEQFAERSLDAAERREARAVLDLFDDSGVVARLNMGQGGKHVHRIIHRRKAEKLKDFVVVSR